jgi:hypothetical protein
VRRLWVALVLLWGVGVLAQEIPTVPDAPIQVFRQPAETDGDTLAFLNLLTGETRRVDVNGARYTVIGDAVMYLDQPTNRVMLLRATGAPRPHPFIQPEPDTRRVDWVVSPDGRLIAWTLTAGVSSDALTTATYVANLDGSEQRLLLTDGPRSGIRALPLAFSPDDTTLYMDYQPDGLSDFTPYAAYAGLFEVNLKDSSVAYLPAEPGCFCGAGFGGGRFVRMALNPDLSGFDLLVADLAAQVTDTIDAVRLRNYTQGGDVLVSPDGTRAVYALAQVQNFGSPEQSVRTVFVLADLETMTQDTLTNPLFNYLRPVAWTEGNSAILFVSANNNTTWKYNLGNNRLEEIARAAYIGTLSPSE